MTGPTPNGRLLDAARHLGMRNDSVGGVRKIQSYFVDEVKAALNQGADLLVRDGDGRDAMDWLTELEDRTYSAANTVAKLLIDKGYPILDNPVLHRMQGQLLEHVCLHLARKERDGKGLRSQQGDTLLHVACQELPTMVRMGTGRDASLRTVLGMANDWLSARNEQGETPLHVFWREQPDLLGLGGSQWKWILSSVLVDCGADLGARKADGRSVLDLMGQQIAQGKILADSPSFGQIEREFAVLVQHQLLDRDTQATQHTRAQPRL